LDSIANLETIKAKVRKLLALSKSDNENEAAIALEKANALIAEYSLDETGLRFESAKSPSTKNYVAWRAVVANAVSWLYCCFYYRNTDQGAFVFVGESLDAFMAAEMNDYLVKTIDMCAKKTIRKNAKSKFRRDFKYGMAIRLYDRIMELGEACSWSPRRNIKIEEAEEHARRSVELFNCKSNKIKLNLVAFQRGAMHGEGVSLARQAGCMPAPMLPVSSGMPLRGELF